MEYVFSLRKTAEKYAEITGLTAKHIRRKLQGEYGFKKSDIQLLANHYTNGDITEMETIISNIINKNF